MIEWLDAMCRNWGSCTQRVLPDVTQSRPTSATLEAVRQQLLTLQAQPVRPADVDDAVPIANALSVPPVMPHEVLASLWFQYVYPAKTPIRIGEFARYLGRRHATLDFWRYLDRAHYFMAARIPPPSAPHQTTPIIEPPLIDFARFANHANAEAALVKLKAAGIPAELLASDGRPVTTGYVGEYCLWIPEELLDGATDVILDEVTVKLPTLKPVPEIEASWLGGLSATQRAQFLMKLSHELTIVGRMLASPVDSAEVRVERLRQLNEVQHRVVNYASYALGPHEDKRFLLPLVKTVLLGWGPRPDTTLRDAAAKAWVWAREPLSSVT